MRIAIDIKGTFEGPKQDIIRAVAKQLHDEGHQITLWSNMVSFAHNVKQELDLPYEVTLKSFGSDLEPGDWYDIAIEDDSIQDFLSAKKIVFTFEFESAEELLNIIRGKQHETTTGLVSNG